MQILKSKNTMVVSGEDAYSFIDSLVSNSINENENKFSYLLGPDGKVKFWFVFTMIWSKFLSSRGKILERRIISGLVPNIDITFIPVIDF